MFSKPTTAGILLEATDRALYEKRAKKLRENQADLANQEEAHFNDLSDAKNEDADCVMDHILFKFPEEIEPYGDTGTDGKVELDDCVFYTVALENETANGRKVNMTSTHYLVTITVGIAGSKTRVGKPATVHPVDAIANKLKGMNLSP